MCNKCFSKLSKCSSYVLTFMLGVGCGAILSRISAIHNENKIISKRDAILSVDEMIESDELVGSDELDELTNTYDNLI